MGKGNRFGNAIEGFSVFFVCSRQVPITGKTRFRNGGWFPPFWLCESVSKIMTHQKVHNGKIQKLKEKEGMRERERAFTAVSVGIALVSGGNLAFRQSVPSALVLTIFATVTHLFWDTVHDFGKTTDWLMHCNLFDHVSLAIAVMFSVIKLNPANVATVSHLSYFIASLVSLKCTQKGEENLWPAALKQWSMLAIVKGQIILVWLHMHTCWLAPKGPFFSLAVTQSLVPGGDRVTVAGCEVQLNVMPLQCFCNQSGFSTETITTWTQCVVWMPQNDGAPMKTEKCSRQNMGFCLACTLPCSTQPMVVPMFRLLVHIPHQLMLSQAICHVLEPWCFHTPNFGPNFSLCIARREKLPMSEENAPPCTSSHFMFPVFWKQCSSHMKTRRQFKQFCCLMSECLWCQQRPSVFHFSPTFKMWWVHQPLEWTPLGQTVLSWPEPRVFNVLMRCGNSV